MVSFCFMRGLDNGELYYFIGGSEKMGNIIKKDSDIMLRGTNRWCDEIWTVLSNSGGCEKSVDHRIKFGKYIKNKNLDD